MPIIVSVPFSNYVFVRLSAASQGSLEDPREGSVLESESRNYDADPFSDPQSEREGPFEILKKFIDDANAFSPGFEPVFFL